jgi:hypothetical protein
MLPPYSELKNKSSQTTSTKQVATRTICLQKTQVYIGNKRDLQDNSSVPTGSLREQTEPKGDKTITSTGPKKGHYANLGTWRKQVIKGVVGKEPRRVGKKLCAWVVSMW